RRETERNQSKPFPRFREDSYNSSMATTTSSTTVPTKTTGRGYLWLGLAVGILAPFLYVAQLAAKRLTAPWSVAILGTAALCLLLLAVIRGRTVGRKIAFLLLGWL